MTADAKPSTQRNRWGQERRLDFIEFRLLWEGRINRGDLVDFFGVSMPQASADLASYALLAPDNLVYDPSEKVYKSSPTFRPTRSSGAPQQYLLHLSALHGEGPSQGTSFIGWAPPYEILETPKRFFPSSALIAVLAAIRTKSALEIVYQSLTGPEPTKRWITPTAIAHDEFRWHVRAWCHTRKRYADFLFARMLELGSTRPEANQLPIDVDWETFVTLVIRPNAELSDAQKRAAELDYGMKNGQFEMTCRKALAFYLLRRLRLDDDDGGPKARQLVLVNRTQVEELLGPSSDYVGTKEKHEARR